MHWSEIPAPTLSALRRGVVIPAHLLALDAQRRLDVRRQRALTARGSGGIDPWKPHTGSIVKAARGVWKIHRNFLARGHPLLHAGARSGRPRARSGRPRPSRVFRENGPQGSCRSPEQSITRV